MAQIMKEYQFNLIMGFLSVNIALSIREVGNFFYIFFLVLALFFLVVGLKKIR